MSNDRGSRPSAGAACHDDLTPGVLVIGLVVLSMWVLGVFVPSLGSGTVHADGAHVGFAQAFVPTFQTDVALNRDFDEIASTGAGWIRFDVLWSVVQADGPDSFDWAATDRAVAATRRRGLHVLANIAYTPTWARPPGSPTDKYAPVDPDDYAEFARAVAQRYEPQGVHAYEIWNEPNTGFWSPRPDPAAYTELLKRAYRAIHDVDHSAIVISGGLAAVGPTLDWTAPDGSAMSPRQFLNAMYAAGASGSFDALGHHPYAIPGGPAAPGAFNAFRQTTALHELMMEHGDAAKKIWGTEVGSFTGTAEGAVSEQEQARLEVEYITRWQRWSYTGPLFLYTLRDRSRNRSEREDNFGILYNDFRPKPAYSTLVALLRPPRQSLVTSQR